MGGLTATIDNLTGLSNTDRNNLISALLGSYAATGTSSCTVRSNGRGTFNYPNHSGLVNVLLGLLGLPSGPPDPRVFYLVSHNQGYFHKTNNAGLGRGGPRAGAPGGGAAGGGGGGGGAGPASAGAGGN